MPKRKMPVPETTDLVEQVDTEFWCRVCNAELTVDLVLDRIDCDSESRYPDLCVVVSMWCPRCGFLLRDEVGPLHVLDMPVVTPPEEQDA